MLQMFSPYDDAPTVLKGTLESNPRTKVVVILQDEDEPETEVGIKSNNVEQSLYQVIIQLLQIIFKSPKSGGCTRFTTDIKAEGEERPETTCIKRVDHTFDTPYDYSNETSSNDGIEKKIDLSDRALNPNGYKYRNKA